MSNKSKSQSEPSLIFNEPRGKYDHLTPFDVFIITHLIIKVKSCFSFHYLSTCFLVDVSIIT
jgi:hypothetical protein